MFVQWRMILFVAEEVDALNRAANGRLQQGAKARVCWDGGSLSFAGAVKMCCPWSSTEEGEAQRR